MFFTLNRLMSPRIEFASLPGEFARVGKLIRCHNHQRGSEITSEKKLSLPVCHGF
jgi:hypothetical protein